jgi:hypothetical protein
MTFSFARQLSKNPIERCKMLRICLATLIVLLAIPVFAQDDTFQVHYAANLNLNDSFIDITNTGATVAAGISQNLCENIYVFDPAEEEIACCTCTVTPNGLVSASVNHSLISNPLTPAIPTSVVVKLVTSAGGACNASAVTAIAHGTAAWMTTTHALTTTTASGLWFQPPTTTPTAVLDETPFEHATLSAAELAHLTSQCGFIQSNGSGFGICGGCQAGGR